MGSTGNKFSQTSAEDMLLVTPTAYGLKEVNSIHQSDSSTDVTDFAPQLLMSLVLTSRSFLQAA